MPEATANTKTASASTSASASSIFINDEECYLNRDLKIVPRVTNCSSYVRHKLGQNVEHHPRLSHPCLEGPNWPERPPEGYACWHCVHTFETTPIPVVNDYYQDLDLYSVYGIFCSANCAKAYLIEREPYLTSRRMLYFHHMLRNVFGIHSAVKPAPPTIRLRMFGGTLTIQQFRANFHMVRVRIVKPPFVSTHMCVEEVAPPTSSQHDLLDDLQARGSKSMFSQFVQSAACKPAEPQKFTRKRKARSKRPTPSSSSSSSSSSSDPRTKMKTSVGLGSILTFRKSSS